VGEAFDRRGRYSLLDLRPAFASAHLFPARRGLFEAVVPQAGNEQKELKRLLDREWAGLGYRSGVA
jgi:hypothetical protein